MEVKNQLQYDMAVDLITRVKTHPDQTEFMPSWLGQLYYTLEQMAFCQDKNMILRMYSSVTRVFLVCVCTFCW